MQGVYSTSILAADTLSKTSHIMAKLRSGIKKRLHILTSSTHKETSLGARQKHEVIIQRRVKQLDDLLDPFAPGSAWHLKTGVIIDDEIINGLLNSTDIGEVLFENFIEQQIKKSG